jgi:hypothetical protein
MNAKEVLTVANIALSALLAGVKEAISGINNLQPVTSPAPEAEVEVSVLKSVK